MGEAGKELGTNAKVDWTQAVNGTPYYTLCASSLVGDAQQTHQCLVKAVSRIYHHSITKTSARHEDRTT